MGSFILVLSIAGGLGYLTLLIYMFTGWNKYQFDLLNGDVKDKSLAVSILIAVRNEEKQIAKCIQSILANSNDQMIYEIIVINDHSEDNTVQEVLNLKAENIKLIHLPDHLRGKKAALSYGVSLAQYDLILCTDGDSVVGKRWIEQHAIMLNQGCNMVTGLVVPEYGIDYLSNFQYLDFIATMCITANGFYRKSYYLANGANMSFKKSFFQLVSGYQDNHSIASGDDIFLMKKASTIDNTKVGFLKSIDGLVQTKSEPTWKALLNQRKRWATKSMKVGDGKVVFIQGYVFLYCVLTIIIMILGLFYSVYIFFFGTLMFVWKVCVDYWFLSSLNSYYKRQSLFPHFLGVSIVYFIHILYSGFSALFPSSYEWKKRVSS